MLCAVVFDMDDTLIDWSEHDIDWSEMRKTHLKPIYDHLYEAGYSLPTLEEFANIYGEIHIAAWEATAPPDWPAPNQRDVLVKSLVRINLDLEKLDVDQLQKLFGWSLLPGVKIFPDAPKVLQTLRQAGIQIGLMTNASSPMWMRDRELQTVGLLEYLDVRMTAGDVGHLKPHRRAFEAVLEQLKCKPENAIYVGDRQHDDVVGAQGVGMRAIWVKRGHEEPVEDIQPDATIHRLSELPGVLDGWFPGWRNNSRRNSE